MCAFCSALEGGSIVRFSLDCQYINAHTDIVCALSPEVFLQIGAGTRLAKKAKEASASTNPNSSRSKPKAPGIRSWTRSIPRVSVFPARPVRLGPAGPSISRTGSGAFLSHLNGARHHGSVSGVGFGTSHIPYYRRKSLTVEGNPLLHKDIPHHAPQPATTHPNPS